MEPISGRLRRTGMSTTLRAALAAPVLLLVLLLVGACAANGESADSAADSGGGSTSDASSSDTKDSDSTLLQSPERASSDVAQDGGAKAKGAAATTPALSRAVISRGEITLRARSLGTARAEVSRLVTAWNGSIADEQTEGDDRGRLLSSTLTLRVPVSRFGEAMSALGGLGRVEHQSRKSEDVTTQVIDNDARVRAAERSIRQIEALLGRATRLSDIIAIEADLARRQADLDSLKSQQAWLEDQTSLSTIVVHLSRSGTDRPDRDDDQGFVAGLATGWTALKGATVAVLTVLGAVLPFATMLALLGVPVWLVVRRRLSAASAPARSA
jgi:hypothetical protein